MHSCGPSPLHIVLHVNRDGQLHHWPNYRSAASPSTWVKATLDKVSNKLTIKASPQAKQGPTVSHPCVAVFKCNNYRGIKKCPLLTPLNWQQAVWGHCSICLYSWHAPPLRCPDVITGRHFITTFVFANKRSDNDGQQAETQSNIPPK